MDYLNIFAPDLRAPPFLGISAHELGVWVKVMSYCCQMENGGRIVGAALWPSEMLLFSLGVSTADLKKCKTLVTTSGTDIVAIAFPVRSLKALNAKRKGAVSTNAKRWGEPSHSESHSDPGSESHSESHRVEGSESGIGIGIEKEGNRNLPLPPPGNVSEGELPFVQLAEALRNSEKVPASTTPATLAVLWRNLAIAGRPDDAGVMEHLLASAAAMPGRIVALGPWLQARVHELSRPAALAAAGVADLGPSRDQL